MFNEHSNQEMLTQYRHWSAASLQRTQHTHGGSQSSLTPIPEDPLLASKGQARMWYTHMYVGETLVHKKQNQTNF